MPDRSKYIIGLGRLVRNVGVFVFTSGLVEYSLWRVYFNKRSGWSGNISV